MRDLQTNSDVLEIFAECLTISNDQLHVTGNDSSLPIQQEDMKRQRPYRPTVAPLSAARPLGCCISEEVGNSSLAARVVPMPTRERNGSSSNPTAKSYYHSRRMVQPNLPMFLTLFLAAISLLIHPTLANHAKLSIDSDFRGDFDQDLVVKIKNPTDVQISPNGGELMMVPDKDGVLYIVQDYEGNNPTVTKALEFKKICTNVERGLSGCAFHPQFGKNDNRYIYLYWTLDKSGDCDTSGSPTRGPVNRLARFVLGENLKVDMDSEEVFFDTPIMPYGSHNSGQIRFGADGHLYISVGDGGGGISTTNDDGVLYPQALDMLLGKILRLAADGGVPDDNPYMKEKSERCNRDGWASKPSIKCQEIYSYGLRNPFRFAMDPNERRRTKFYINDVGRHTWESIRPAGDGFEGANYGYPDREGPCKKKQSTNCKPPNESEGFTEPIHWFLHDSEDGGAVTGGAFYPNDAGWHPSFRNSYLYADYAYGGIYRMVKGDGECAYPKCDPPISAFAGSVKVLSDYKRVTAMEFGPHKGGKALYLATRGHTGGNGDMGIFRVSYNGPLHATEDEDSDPVDEQVQVTPAPVHQPTMSNRPPKAVLKADKVLGFPPFTVMFDATESFDRGTDGKSFGLLYKFDFDGDGETDPSSGPIAKHTYAKSGTYYAYVTVLNDQGMGDVAEIMIEVEKAPSQPIIIEPDGDSGFAVGDTIRLAGASLDVEGGPPLPDRAFTWEVRYHHVDHYHVVMEPTVGNHLDFVAPNALDLETAKGSHLVVLLTVTDDSGLSMTTERIISPKMAQLLFVTVPTGLALEIDGTRYTTPITLQTWENHRFEIEAPAQRKDYYSTEFQRMQSGTYIWENWSDGQPQVHGYVAQSSEDNIGAIAIVARFRSLNFGSDSGVVDMTSSSNSAFSRTVDGQVTSAIFIGIGAAGVFILSGLLIYIVKSRSGKRGSNEDDCDENIAKRSPGSIEHAPTDDSRPSSVRSDGGEELA